MDEDEITHIYKVIVNGLGEYSIWPSYRMNPLGWSDAGFEGTEKACLERAKELWKEIGHKPA